MVVYKDECRGCASPGYPCIGNACIYKRVPHLICDECGAEVDEGDLYVFDARQMCIDCIKEELEEVSAW